MNNLAVSFATAQDEDWLTIKDSNHYISANLVSQKIERQEYIIARQANKQIGYLRYSYFWSFIPFIDIIAVEKAHQRQGVGRAMLEFLEAFAKKKSCPFILSSSQTDEAEPQAWHRHSGFKDAGALTNLQPLQTVSELLFIKQLNKSVSR